MRILRSANVADAAEAERLFAEPLWGIILEARREAFLKGAQFAGEQALKFGYRPPDIPMAGYSPEAVKTVLREEWRGDSPWDTIVERIEGHIFDASRQAVMTSVEVINDDVENESLTDSWDDLDAEFASTQENWARDVILEDGEEAQAAPEGGLLGWARVLTGNDNCSFCIMLASRGPVYESSAAAGRIKASSRWGDAKGYLNRYHTNCDCSIVMVPRVGKWAGAEQAAAAKQIYKDASDRVKLARKGKAYANGKKYSENLILKEIDKILRERAEAGRPVQIPAYAA